MSEILIDGDKTPTHERIWGKLDGWNEEPGRWEVVLMTRSGWVRFRSSDPDSAEVTAMVRRILRGELGILFPRNWNIELHSGCLVMSQTNPVTVPSDPAESLVATNLKTQMSILASLLGGGLAVEQAMKHVADNGGLDLLLAKSPIVFAGGVNLSWTGQFEPQDLSILVDIGISSPIRDLSNEENESLPETIRESCDRLSSLELELGPSPVLDETLGFGVFQIPQDGVLDDTFKTLFFVPSWIARKWAPRNQYELSVFPQKYAVLFDLNRPGKRGDSVV